MIPFELGCLDWEPTVKKASGPPPVYVKSLINSVDSFNAYNVPPTP